MGLTGSEEISDGRAGESLRDRCHVNTNDEGDSFVGVKADTEGAVVYFPIGYQLPNNDNDLRADIVNLLYTLAAFMKEDRLLEESKFIVSEMADFPIHAYLQVIRNFLRTGCYYIESDPQFKTGATGQTAWARTVREHRFALLRRMRIKKSHRSIGIAYTRHSIKLDGFMFLTCRKAPVLIPAIEKPFTS